MSELEIIHTITGVRTESQVNAKGNPYEAVQTNCFGWYPSLDEALVAAEGNACDINEAGHYPYLVVESVPPGVYGGGMAGEGHWFLWVQEGKHSGEGHYAPCEPPEGIATMDGMSVIAFGMS